MVVGIDATPTLFGGDGAEERMEKQQSAGEAVYAVPLYDVVREGGNGNNAKSKWGPQDKPYYEVDPSMCGNHLKYLNHTCGVVEQSKSSAKKHGPNVAKAFVHLPGAAAPTLMLYTARDVEAGEELVWHYMKDGDKGCRCITCCRKSKDKFPGVGADEGFIEAKPPPPRAAPKPPPKSTKPPLPPAPPKQKQKHKQKQKLLKDPPKQHSAGSLPTHLPRFIDCST